MIRREIERHTEGAGVEVEQVNAITGSRDDAARTGPDDGFARRVPARRFAQVEGSAPSLEVAIPNNASSVS